MNVTGRRAADPGCYRSRILASVRGDVRGEYTESAGYHYNIAVVSFHVVPHIVARRSRRRATRTLTSVFYLFASTNMASTNSSCRRLERLKAQLLEIFANLGLEDGLRELAKFEPAHLFQTKRLIGSVGIGNRGIGAVRSSTAGGSHACNPGVVSSPSHFRICGPRIVFSNRNEHRDGASLSEIGAEISSGLDIGPSSCANGYLHTAQFLSVLGSLE